MHISFELSCYQANIGVDLANNNKKIEILEKDIRESDQGYVYKFITSDLLPNSRYSYRIDAPFDTEWYHFTFNPSIGSKNITLVGFGDNQRHYEIFNNLLHTANEYKPDYIFHTGDLVQNEYDQNDWRHEFLSPLVSKYNSNMGSTTPMIFARGNHDWNEKDNKYLYVRENKWFATTLGNSRWIVLETNYDTKEQDEWLEVELKSEKTKQAKFVIVLAHIAPYIEWWDPETWIGKNERVWGDFMRKRYVPLFEKYGVDLVIASHEHAYQRGQKNKVVYTITGGAGGNVDAERVEDYGFYDITLLTHFFIKMTLSNNTIEWSAISPTNELLDTFTITK